MGLSVASTIIKNHNGEIKVESKEGKWTRFIIALPSARKEIPDVYASNREDHRKKIFDKKTLKVLVVDDEEIILKSMSRILKIYNCDAVCVLDGRKGIELARTEKFDLIILDLLLPEITGEKIFKEIREFDKDTPIIFISGQINLEVEKLKKIGAFDVIQKPFDMEELHIVLENLRNFMDERNQRVGIFTQMRK